MFPSSAGAAHAPSSVLADLGQALWNLDSRFRCFVGQAIMDFPEILVVAVGAENGQDHRPFMGRNGRTEDARGGFVGHDNKP